MTFRYYVDQLAKMEPARRQQLESCAAARTEKWIDVPLECIEPRTNQRATSAVVAPASVRKPSSSYRPELIQAPSLTGGPGDLVKIVLDKLGIKPKSKCGCDAMRRQMNGWGYGGCWAHRDEIADWFAAKASETGIDMNAAGVMRLVGERIWKKLTAGQNDTRPET